MKLSFDRDWLLSRANSIRPGRRTSPRPRLTHLDPPLVAAAYNAGGLDKQTRREPLEAAPVPHRHRRALRSVRALLQRRVFVLGFAFVAPVVSVDGLLTGSRAAGRRRRRAARARTGPRSVRAGRARRGATAYSRGVLVKDILRRCGRQGALVSSTAGSPADQARVMYDNCERYGPERGKRLYRGPGREGDRRLRRRQGGWPDPGAPIRAGMR